MSIIQMVNGPDYPEGAFNWLTDKKNIVGDSTQVYYALHEKYHGLCLFEREQNGYHDSDFFMTIWNEETQSPFEICFATTRGWTYPCYASRPDATPEILEKYKEYEKKQAEIRRIANRKSAAKKLLTFKNELKEVAKRHETSYIALLQYRKTNVDFRKVYECLLKPNIRNEFKKNLRKQVLTWLNSSDRKYKQPLSRKQMKFLM